MNQLQRLNDELLLRLQKASHQNKELKNQLKEERKGEEIYDEWGERDDDLAEQHPGLRYLKPHHRVISKIDRRHPRLFETIIEAKTSRRGGGIESRSSTDALLNSRRHRSR